VDRLLPANPPSLPTVPTGIQNSELQPSHAYSRQAGRPTQNPSQRPCGGGWRAGIAAKPLGKQGRGLVHHRHPMKCCPEPGSCNLKRRVARAGFAHGIPSAAASRRRRDGGQPHGEMSIMALELGNRGATSRTLGHWATGGRLQRLPMPRALGCLATKATTSRAGAAGASPARSGGHLGPPAPAGSEGRQLMPGRPSPPGYRVLRPRAPC
jgi:hypothetical protein